jgi:hypothetical protein
MKDKMKLSLLSFNPPLNNHLVEGLVDIGASMFVM